jgi:hypothetical protein
VVSAAEVEEAAAAAVETDVAAADSETADTKSFEKHNFYAFLLFPFLSFFCFISGFIFCIFCLFGCCFVFFVRLCCFLLPITGKFSVRRTQMSSRGNLKSDAASFHR